MTITFLVKIAQRFPHEIRFCFVQFSGYITLLYIPHSSECGIFLFVENFLFDTGRFLTGFFLLVESFDVGRILCSASLFLSVKGVVLCDFVINSVFSV